MWSNAASQGMASPLSSGPSRCTRALAGLPSGRREKEEVDRKLAELGLEGTARAETLDLEQHLRLAEVFG